MKIIDFKKKGNLVRFYLGADDCDDYYGDDWDDAPYEHNAGQVYSEFVVGTMDVVFPFRYFVMEPQDDWHNEGNSHYCKDDMRDRKVPCIVAVEPDDSWYDANEFNYWLGNDRAEKIYFGDNPIDLLTLKGPIILNYPPELLNAMVSTMVSHAVSEEVEADGD